MRKWVVGVQGKPSDLLRKYNIDLDVRNHVLIQPRFLLRVLRGSTDRGHNLHDLGIHGNTTSVGLLFDLPLLFEVRRHQAR